METGIETTNLLIGLLGQTFGWHDFGVHGYLYVGQSSTHIRAPRRSEEPKKFEKEMLS